MRSVRGWTAYLILTLLMSCPMRPLYATLKSESEMMPRSECEKELTKQWLSHDEELMELGQEHERDMRQLSAECEVRVRQAAADGTTAGAAEAARPLLIQIAGLEADLQAARDRNRRLVRISIGIAAGGVGLTALAALVFHAMGALGIP